MGNIFAKIIKFRAVVINVWKLATENRKINYLVTHILLKY